MRTDEQEMHRQSIIIIAVLVIMVALMFSNIFSLTWIAITNKRMNRIIYDQDTFKESIEKRLYFKGGYENAMELEL